MKLYTILIFLIMTTPNQILFNFTNQASASSWQIVNDGVMGGKSSSTLKVSDDGHGVFSGHVSLANNGGFASVRHLQTYTNINSFEYVALKIKGDTKNYQFRLKGAASQRQSYVQEFETTGEWQEVKLKIKDFYPQFRGQKLNMENFNFDEIAEMAFLIANKKEENFKLIIDKISLQ